MNIKKWLSHRWPFLVAMTVLCLVMLVWRVLLWPGAITHDGLWVLQGAESGAVTTYHPYLNSLLARLFAIPFGTIGIYVALQTLYCLWVLGWIISRVHTRTGSAVVVLAITLLLVSSIPTGLYIGMFWKDIPFSFGVLFVAFALYDLKDNHGLAKGKSFWVLLCLSITFLTFMRHGHLFNLVLVPALLYLVARERKAAIISLLSGVTVWVVIALSSVTWLRVANDENHLARVGVLVVMQPFLAMLAAPGGYVSDDPAIDQVLLAQVFVPDVLQKYNPKYGDAALVRPGEELPPGIRNKLAKRVAKLCALNISKCVGDRVALFFATLFPADRAYGMTFYDLGLYEGNCQQVYGMRPDHCWVLDRYVAEEKVDQFKGLSRRVIDKVEQREDWVKRLLLWNGAIGLATLLFVLLMYNMRNRMWWSGLFVAAQCTIPFAFSTASDFRYYYPLHLWGLVFFPLVVYVSVSRMKQWRGSKMQS